MYKIIRKQEASVRQITENKTVRSFITKDISPDVSLAVIKNKGHFREVVAKNNRIYYVLEGKLVLDFDNKEIELNKNDVCFISRGTKYDMSGDCRVIAVDQPAFGT